MSYPATPGNQPPYPPFQPPAPRKKRHILRNVFLSAGGVIVLIVVLGVVFGGGTTITPSAVTGCANATGPCHPVAPATTTTAAAAPVVPVAPQYTATQQQAIDAAEGYLSDGQGFSKAGLIGQLDSPDGDGFSESDARFAVDHVSVSWRAQAVISAKGYMSDGEGFSYSSLVQQLDSPDGEQFTYSQAVYAAKAVGL